MTIKYPHIKEELIALDEEDQKEIRHHYQHLQEASSVVEKKQLNDQLATHCHIRAHRMLVILDEIKKPTTDNIGVEGSQAVSLLALHAYVPVMKKVLAIYERIYKTDPTSIYYQAIPPLTDRIMILEQRLQKFGTNWCMDKNGKLFLVPVTDFAHVNKRRREYGLDPIKRPVILSVGAEKNPLGSGDAQASDQKELTDDEYEEYSRYYLKSMVS
ncbi:MAG: hypothetical protein NVSMB46_02000 [Candidatus Saccharimonadales bacterium]